MLPLIQSVSLSGKTVAEATDLIQKKYAAGFVKDPHILLTVLEYRKTTFSILGQVEKPGIYEIPEGTHMSIVDAVLLAGGFTRIAAQNDVRIKRMVRGKAAVFKVKAGSMADDANVPPLRGFYPATSSRFRRAGFSFDQVWRESAVDSVSASGLPVARSEAGVRPSIRPAERENKVGLKAPAGESR